MTPLTGAALEQALAPLHARRSANKLDGPGPDDAQLAALLAAAATAPDHGSLRPYRFVVVRGAGLPVLGQALVAAARDENPELDPAIAAKLAGKATVAPVMAVLIASPRASGKVPEWEQLATAACAGFGLVLAADLAGFGAVWKSAPFLRGTALGRILGLAEDEQVLGWVNLGTRAGTVPARRDVPAVEFATRLEGPAPSGW